MTSIDKLQSLWCRLKHDSAYWPIHGQYACVTCGRRYEVPWNKLEAGYRPQAVPAHYAISSTRSTQHGIPVFGE